MSRALQVRAALVVLPILLVLALALASLPGYAILFAVLGLLVAVPAAATARR